MKENTVRKQMLETLKQPPTTVREALRHLGLTLLMCWDLGKKHRSYLIATYIVTIVMEGLGFLLPWFLSTITATISARPHSFTLYDLRKPLVGILVLWIISIAVNTARERMASYVRAELSRDLPVEAIKRLLSLDRSFHQDNNMPELTAKITRGYTSVADVVGSMQFNVLPRSTFLIATVGLLAWIHPWFALLSMILLAFYLVVMLKGRIKSLPAYTAYEAARSAGEAYAGESGMNASIAQAFNREKAVVDRVRELQTHAHDHYHAFGRIQMMNWVLRAIVGDHIQWLMVILAILLEQTGYMNLTQFLFSMTLILKYREEMFNFGWIYNDLVARIGNVLCLYTLLHTEPKIVDPVDPKKLPHMSAGSIEFDHVSYVYPANQGKKPVPYALKDISFGIKPGEVVGILGRSGDGKSTLLELITRGDDSTKGTIRVNEVDIKTVSLEGLRNEVILVQQEPLVSNDTVRANIDFGRGYSQEEIEAAARMAHAHEFILSLPEGYDTVIGDRGAKLSGGQKQRICLARAVIGKPSVLILDEATANIDALSIEKILQAFEEIKGTCTIVIVSHQLSTIQRLADRIIVIVKGKIVEVGTHAELLLKKHGFYRRFVKAQQRHDRTE